MGKRLPPLNQLQAFEAAARHVSFKKAAEELHVTRAAVSHQIRALEEHLGVQLFRRVDRGVELNEGVEKYCEAVRKILNELARARDFLPPSPTSNTLSISVAPSFGTRWLLPRLSRFELSHPEIEISAEWSTTVANFTNGQVSLSLRSGYGDWPGAATRLIFRERYAPAFSPSLFATCHSQPTAAQIANMQMISSVNLETEWIVWCEQFNIPAPEPRNLIVLPSQSHAIDAAKSGVGVVLVDKRLIEAELASKALVQDASKVSIGERGIYAVHPENSKQRPHIEAFIDWLLNEVERSA